MWWTMSPMILTLEFWTIGGWVTRSIVKEIMSMGVVSMGMVTRRMMTMGVVPVKMVSMRVMSMGMLTMRVVGSVIMRGSMAPVGTRRRRMARGQLWKGSFLKGWSV